MNPQLSDAILCEDIRQELGNKVSLVGVLGRKIFLPPDATFPGRVPQLAVFTRWSGLTEGEKVSLGVESGQEVIVDPKGTAVVGVVKEPDEYTNVIFQLPGFPIRGFGEFKFKIYLDNDQSPRAQLCLQVEPQPESI